MAYESKAHDDFLVSATPGAGKTTFALTLALRLRERKVVNRIIVVAPTDHLRTQWADAASAVGLVLDPTLKNSDGPVRKGSDGYVTKLVTRGYKVTRQDVTIEKTVSGSYGERQLVIDLPYGSNTNTANNIATYLSTYLSTPEIGRAHV